MSNTQLIIFNYFLLMNVYTGYSIVDKSLWVTLIIVVIK